MRKSFKCSTSKQRITTQSYIVCTLSSSPRIILTWKKRRQGVKVSTVTESSIYETYKELDQLWTWCLDVYKDTESKARVNGVQSQTQSFDYFFGLRLGTLLLRHSDNLSISLQAEDLCAAQAQPIAKNTASTLEKMRTDQNFDLFWTDVNSKAEALDVDEPTLSRRRRHPSRIDDYYGKAVPEFPADVILHYRRIYFESLEKSIPRTTGNPK